VLTPHSIQTGMAKIASSSVESVTAMPTQRFVLGR
jgi:hypothetical protein